MQTVHSRPIIRLMHPIFGYVISNVLLHLNSLHFPNQPVVLFLGPDLRQLSWTHWEKKPKPKNTPTSFDNNTRLSLTDLIHALVLLLTQPHQIWKKLTYPRQVNGGCHLQDEWKCTYCILQ